MGDQIATVPSVGIDGFNLVLPNGTGIATYGFALSGAAAYTRLFGQVFSPAVTLIFVLKTLFFCLAVSLIPMASALYGMSEASVRTSAEMRGLVRMFAVILLIEVASLVGNYY